MDWENAKIVSFEQGGFKGSYNFSNFIETGSRSPKIICSLVKTSEPSLRSVSARAYQYNNTHGILVTAHYELIVKSAKLTLLLMQEGAAEPSFQVPVSVEY